MKKKAYLAALLMCVALTAAACGEDNTKTEDGAKTEASEEIKETEDAQEAEETEEETEENTGRLVTVDSVDKYITIGEYQGLALEKVVQEVTDDQIQAEIDQVLTEKAEKVNDKKETVKEGDIATINYVGTKDGEEFDGGTANNYDLTIGSDTFIDGFEDGIVGMKEGETKDLNLTFPEEYPEESLAGQDVVFKVTVNSFKRPAELTDEWVKANTESDSVDAYKESIKKELEDQASQDADLNMENTAWNTVYEASEVKEYPQADIDNEIEEYKKQIEAYAQQASMELEDFVTSQGMTMEAFEEQCQQYAEYKVKQNLIVQGIMDKEGMSLDDEESQKILQDIVEQYGMEDEADLVANYGQIPVNETVGITRVCKFIVESAEVAEMIDSGDGQVGANADADAEEPQEEGSEETSEVSQEAENGSDSGQGEEAGE